MGSETISSLPVLLTISQAQPLPKRPRPAASNFSLNASKLPKVAVMSSASAPVGAPPAWGARLRQKAVWLTCPPALLREQIEVVLPDRPGVAARIHVPNVCHPLFLEVTVNSLADAHQSVLVSARYPKQLQLFGRLRRRHQLRWGLGVGRRRKSAYPGKSFEMSQPEI